MTARSFFGWLLMVVGGLVAVFAGGCTVLLMGGTLFDMLNGIRSDSFILGLAPIVGGIPCIIGIALFFWGRRLHRPKDMPLAGNAPAEPQPVLGRGLMVAGAAIAGGPALFAANMAGEELLHSEGGNPLALVKPLLITGIPIIIGLVMYRQGRKLRDGKNE